MRPDNKVTAIMLLFVLSVFILIVLLLQFFEGNMEINKANYQYILEHNQTPSVQYLTQRSMLDNKITLKEFKKIRFIIRQELCESVKLELKK